MTYNEFMNNPSKGNTTIIWLAVIGIASLLAYLGLEASVLDSQPQVDMRIEPQQQIVTVGEIIEVRIIVESNIAVNVFFGNLSFNPDVLTVAKIDYNTSIADLWAQRPWYDNGNGTMNFAGGTTQPGGFVGTGELIKITFKTLQTGSGEIKIEDARILQHDGLGTDADLAPSIDSIVTVNDVPETREVLYTSGPRTAFLVTEDPPSTDLNADGRQSVADLSIFMSHLAAKNMRSDFNKDGKVNLADLSILMQAE